MNPYLDIVEHGGGLLGARQTAGLLGNQVKDSFQSLHPMDQAALLSSPLPVVGDAMGLLADARMFMQEPESRTPVNFGLSGLGLLPFIPNMGMIKASHGTPHKVDKFSMDKIGTGEGAQAYGHGLYFAESPDVAKSYAPRKYDTEEVLLKEYDDAYAKGDYDKASIYEMALLHESPQEMRARIALDAEGDPDYFQRLSKQIDDFEAKGYEGTQNVYNVNIDVEPEDLLDWDAPLSEQKTAMRKAINNLIRGDDRFKNTRKYLSSKLTAEDLYRYMQTDLSASQKEVSEILKQQGIPGIKYYDGMSRSAGKGTRNYVIFDDSLIDIVK